MKFCLDENSTSYRITGYGRGRVIINEEVLTRSLLIMPEQLVKDWPPQNFDALEPSHFAIAAGLNAEILILGCGARQRFPPARLTRALTEAGIGLEVMDTGAACRTFNLLAADGRRVAAALLMIED